MIAGIFCHITRSTFERQAEKIFGKLQFPRMYFLLLLVAMWFSDPPHPSAQHTSGMAFFVFVYAFVLVFLFVFVFVSLESSNFLCTSGCHSSPCPAALFTIGLILGALCKYSAQSRPAQEYVSV